MDYKYNIDIKQLEEAQNSSLGFIKSRQFPGIKELLSKLYPEKNHFIYELLQNAEDAGATKVYFRVYKDKLVFKHNGTEPFSIKHIEAITNISASTKDGEEGKAGKFGIGFKAVYAFTDTPFIYTEDVCFKIVDVFLPELIPPIDIHGETVFVFPFNNKKLLPKDAVKIIEEGLKDIEDSTLLFLNNIKEIEYVLLDGNSGVVCAKHNVVDYFKGNKGVPFVEIIQCSAIFDKNNIYKESWWLRFNRKAIIDLDCKKTNMWVNIAYPINIDNNDLKQITFKNSSLNNNVSIYFPARNACSNLRFSINAPFACPPTRDSVSEVKENQELIEEIAKLTKESILYLRNSKLLTPSFYSLMPLQSDDVHEFYYCIVKAIKEIFQNEDLYLTIDEEYKKRTQVVSANVEIRNLLNICDTRLILSEKDIYYLKNPLNRGLTFIKECGIETFDPDVIIENLVKLNDKNIKKILEGKDDKWVIQFYALLRNATFNIDTSLFENLKIVLTKDNEYVAPIDARMLENDNIILNPKYKEVKGSLYQGIGMSNDSRIFLKNIGVKTYTENDEKVDNIEDKKHVLIDRIRCYKFDLLNINEFMSLTKEIIKYFRDNYGGELQSIKFVLDDKNNLKAACQCFIDCNQLKTGLSKAKHIHKKHAISEYYEKYLTQEEYNIFLKLIQKQGVFYKLEIVHNTTSHEWETPAYCNNPKRDVLENAYRCGRPKYKITSDWNIPDLESYCRLQNKDISLLIWNCIKTLKEYSQTNQAYVRWGDTVSREVPSTLVQILQNNKWLPNRDGEFLAPEEISESELDTDFELSMFDTFITRILCLGKQERQKRNHIWQEEQKRSENNKLAQSLGFNSYDELLTGKELVEKQKQGILLELKQNPEKPVGTTKSRIILDQNISKYIEDVKLVSRTEKERRVRVSECKKESRDMLKTYYTNEDEEMVCQVCGKEMPFKNKHGEYYFEAVEIDLKSQYFRLELKEKYIACCPNCAALVREYITSDKGVLTSLITNIIMDDAIRCENGNRVVEIQTKYDKPIKIEFIGKHYDRLNALLKRINVLS